MNDTVETLFDAYLEGEGMTELNKELREVSSGLDAKLAAGTLTCEDLAEYEAVAAHAAFYAGFNAAKELI